MTEHDWLTAKDAVDLFRYVSGWATARKVRLALCACLRSSSVWPLLTSKASRRAVEVSEAYADSETGVEELGRARKGAGGAFLRTWERSRASFAAGALASNICLRDGNLTGYGLSGTISHLATGELILPVELVRDVFGNPFELHPPLPSGIATTAVGLAEAAYGERTLPSGELDPTRLAVLADAVEETGCRDTSLLSHLRSPGPHVRGCWTLDLLRPDYR